jgi:hypothetical protein
MHTVHTPANLPRIALERLRVLARDEWWGPDARPRLVLIPFVAAGLFAVNASLGFALLCSVALFLGYLAYGHWSEWTLYYFEGMPALSVLAALGVWRAIRWLVEKTRAANPEPALRRAAFAASLILAAITAYELQHWRSHRRLMADWDESFRASLDKLPAHSAGDKPHASIVANSPHLDDEPIWIVNDLGEHDRELLKYSGPRIPLNFYEDGSRFEVARSLLGPPPK